MAGADRLFLGSCMLCQAIFLLIPKSVILQLDALLIPDQLISKEEPKHPLIGIIPCPSCASADDEYSP